MSDLKMIDKECCAKKPKFVETIRTISSQNKFPLSIKMMLDEKLIEAAQESDNNISLKIPNKYARFVQEHYISEGFDVEIVEKIFGNDNIVTYVKIHW